MASPKVVISAVKAKSTFKRADKSSRSCARNWIERLPSEILIKILSYLDAAALFMLSHVSSLFYQLASDNALWHRIFLKEFGSKRKRNPKFVEDLLKMTADVRDLDIGHWKWLYFKTAADFDMYKWKKLCCAVNRHTGMPSKTDKVLSYIHKYVLLKDKYIGDFFVGLINGRFGPAVTPPTLETKTSDEGSQ